MPRTALVAIAFLLTTPAIAAADGIGDRQTFQYGQIEQGRQVGSITWTEGLRLRAEQQHITQVRNDLEQDGALPKVNRRVLYRMQDEAAEHIEQARENGLHRLQGLPRVGR
jgi:hypothetical protein